MQRTTGLLLPSKDAFSVKDLFTFIYISLIACVFGAWFALNQLKAVAPAAMDSYPQNYYFLTIFKVYLSIIAFYCLSLLSLSAITQNRVKLLDVALSFSPLVLVFANVSLLYVVSGILLLQIMIIFARQPLRETTSLASRYSFDMAVLLIYFLAHFFLTTRLSPLNWDQAMLAAAGFNAEESYVLAPIFKGFVLAKQFSFSNIDHSQWAGIMNPPGSMTSPFFQLITLIFDLPSVSYPAFHVGISLINFMLAIGGSFGLYLFLKYAACLNNLFSFLGGILFFFGITPIISTMFLGDAGIFLSAYAVFPYALLLISLSFRKQSLCLAAWAGLALASQFFIITPHPEGVIYSYFFYGLYVLALMYFSKEMAWKLKFLLAGTTILLSLLLSAFVFVPILYDQLSGNMFVFAHTGDIAPTPLDDLKRYIVLFAIMFPISWLLLLRDNKPKAVYYASVVLSVLILSILLLTTNIHLMNSLVKRFHIGLHYWFHWRIGMYYCLSVIIVSMYALNQLFALSWHFLSRKLRMSN